MKKQAPNFEWQIVESYVDWERLAASPRPDTTTDTLHPLRLQPSLSTAVVLLLLLAAIGMWWRSFHAETQQATVPSSPVAVEQLNGPLLATPCSSRSNLDLWYESAQKYKGLLAEPFKIPLDSNQVVAAVGTGCSAGSPGLRGSFKMLK